jgi:hypothetical protein
MTADKNYKNFAADSHAGDGKVFKGVQPLNRLLIIFSAESADP